ncbi:MAG: hypothetical protein OXI26_14290 [bacterium]|nr:hypothetical protein [bacterium]
MREQLVAISSATRLALANRSWRTSRDLPEEIAEPPPRLQGRRAGVVGGVHVGAQGGGA